MDELSLVSLKELASILKLSYATVKRWRKEGRLPVPFIIDGKRPYWTREQIAMWQRAHLGVSRAR